MERVKTGISGLDSLIAGGIVKGDSVLISGAPGTGKSILGMQYLYNGAIEEDDPGLYISFEETTDRIKQHFRALNWDIDKLDKESKLSIVSLEPVKSEGTYRAKHLDEFMFNFRTIETVIEHAVETIGAKRVVIDSLSALTSFAHSSFEMREVVLYLKDLLNSHGCTSLFLTQTQKENAAHAIYEETLVDGIIYLYYQKKDLKRVRSLEVIKMRDTEHYEGMYSLKISKKGIEVFPFKTDF